MNARMDGWTDRRMDGSMHGCMDASIDLSVCLERFLPQMARVIWVLPAV